ncbi:MAG: adenylate/guanylate cyclase domain-containing protein [Betaproteobacteria bacterium]
MDTTLDGSTLFARVIGGSDAFTPAARAAAEEALARCLGKLQLAAEAKGGRVVKILRDKLMLLAETPDGAADVAAALHGVMDDLPPVAGTPLALAVGFHHGPLVRVEQDLFGTTVNLAARLADQAIGGTILTSDQTARRLGAPYRGAMRRVTGVRVRGISEDLDLCELLWRADGESTMAPLPRPSRVQREVLRVRYEGTVRELGDPAQAMVIGRDTACDLVVLGELASRQHCTIERRRDRFVLSDHSTNGTYVTIDGRETRLHREEFVLARSGWVAFGQPRADGVEGLAFGSDAE